MRSIGARLAMWYALASTATMAALFFAGYFLLEGYLIHGLDLLNEAQFEQIDARLKPDYDKLNAKIIETRIRDITESASVLFYVDIHPRKSATIFYSSNLRGATIPDLPGTHYNATMNSVGEVRVNEFLMGPFELMVATPLAQVRKVMEGYLEVSFGLLAVVVAVSAAIGYGLSRVALRPVRAIQETAMHIGSDNLSERIKVGEVKDEISNLAKLLNEMFDRLESAFNQTRRFTAEASHELKTPLSLVRLQAEKLLVDGGLNPAQEEAVQIQLEEIGRLHKIIEELLFLSRAEAGAITLALKPHQTKPFLLTFTQDARVLSEHRGVHFVEDIALEGEVNFDPKWIRQVLFNLVANALNVSKPGDTITLSSVIEDGEWRVCVDDEGPGVPVEQRERMFQRFVRLEKSPLNQESGSGLGLTISRSIIGLHRGKIWAEANAKGRGLRLIFQVPATALSPRSAGHDIITVTAPARTSEPSMIARSRG